jgi:hypothetical protein
VIGVGDQPQHEVPDVARHALAAYIQIPSWADEDGALATMLGALRGHNVDLVESLWEPTMLLAARLREAIGVPGLTVEQTVPFRDKGRMKEVLEAAGIRTPRSARSTTVAGCREAAEQIGYPLIIKPIAGAGSLDTYRIEDQADFEDALARLGHIPEVSVEEFIDGDELTYDTVCAAGSIAIDNICWYRPPGPRCAGPGRGTRHGRGRDRGHGVHERFHAHGVVPQAGRRGRVRRDRCPRARRPADGPHELRL